MTDYPKGYFRFPSVNGDLLAFISEDDLWTVPTAGGMAQRITSNLGIITQPNISPNGEWIAFSSMEEGAPEIYRVPAQGGPAERLTYLGSNSMVVGWKENLIVFACDLNRPFPGSWDLQSIDPETREIKSLNYGVASHVSWGDKGVVIGRNTGDLARWKRYRGGRTGHIWVDEAGNGEFKRLSELEAGNVTSPMWIGDRIFFLSDQNGIGNLFSCKPDGKDIKQHTRHRKYFARYANTDGKVIIYQNGAELYLYDIAKNKSAAVKVTYPSPRVQLQRKFVPVDRHLENYNLNPDGGKLAIGTRGKLFTMADWDGIVTQHGEKQGVRYRLASWDAEGKNIVLSSDATGDDRLEIHSVEDPTKIKTLKKLAIGRPMSMDVAPKGNKILVANHRHELIIVDLDAETAETIDQNKFGPLGGHCWSHDGSWLAYAISINHSQMVIRLYNLETGSKTDVTDPVLIDHSPCFDPEGKYLYFLSGRVFDPVHDNMHFDYNFPRGERPYLITLRKDVTSPFIPEAKGFGQVGENDKKNGKDEEGNDNANEEKPEEAEEEKALEIDLDGISERMIAFPVAEGKYSSLYAIKDRVFWTTHPVAGALSRSWADQTPKPKAVLKVYDFSKQEEGTFVSGITSYTVSANGAALAYRVATKLRVVDAKRDVKSELPKESEVNRKNGWINLGRIKLAIEPVEEWRQMFREAWRLQRDYFWVEDMSDINWKKVYDRYYPLIANVGCRSEFSDLMWEMQGELGTSHAYEMGGEYRPHPVYLIGHLGAEMVFDEEAKAYRFKRIARGDTWHEKLAPPLKRPGVNVSEGMLLLKVNGEKLDMINTPSRVLLNLSGSEAQLEVADEDGSNVRTVFVKTLPMQSPLWYRDWVEKNRAYVHDKSGGKVGYVHIPDMSPGGYAEFHRYFLSEWNYDSLIIDVRHNGGGHVSPLLLEKLARKRLGYSVMRWIATEPTPGESPAGPMVALTDEYAGSDGDMFSHSFKMLKLGKLIGVRTWGGVIGIWPRNWLVDGTVTTQPEFSHFYNDVGYGVENYGTDPDIEVEIRPQDFAAGVDPQLDRGIKEVMALLKKNPPKMPDLDSTRNKLPLPK